MLFDIMQSKLSENVQPVTSQHIAVGQHCIDMLTKKDKNWGNDNTNIANQQMRRLTSKQS